MDEAHVKAAVLARVRAITKGRARPVIASEFSLGSSGVRADLAIFAEMTTGIEIKTEKDTLRRIPAQMSAYSRYFDNVHLIVAKTHLRSLFRLDVCRAFIWSYDEAADFTIVKRGLHRNVDPEERDMLLTQAERKRLSFNEAMNLRYGETSRRFWTAVSRRKVRPEDLVQLSRFSDARALAQQTARERDERWSIWLSAQTSSYPVQSSSVSSAMAGSE